RTATLQGYVVRQLVIRTAAAAAVIVTLLQLFEMLGRATEILERGVGLGGLAYYMLLAAPSMLQQSVGFAMFAGVVLTFTELARKGEMIAMRAAGVSLRQLVGMLIPVALAVGAIALVVGDQVAPMAERTMQAWLQATAKPGPGAQTGPRWFRVGADIVRADNASRQGDVINGVRIYRRDDNQMLRERIVAASATAGPDGWVLRNVQTLIINSDRAQRSASTEAPWTTSLKPGDVTDIFQPTLQISAIDAYRGLNGAANDKSAGYLLTRLYRLLAEPLAPLVMLLLASPLAMVNGRNVRGVGPVLYGVGGGMAYLVADGLLTASGQTGVLPATAAAWTAPLIFAIAAFTVLLYVEL
ncbi:MAG: LptF/LptG family permease, partial [Caulobacteraceae bacterium]